MKFFVAFRNDWTWVILILNYYAGFKYMYREVFQDYIEIPSNPYMKPMGQYSEICE